MAAVTGTAANVHRGFVQSSSVTNTYGGYLISDGSAHTLTLPFQSDQFEWWRYTAYGTAGTLGNGCWFRDFPAGDSLITQAIADNGSTGDLNLVLETTNGVTVADTSGGFTDEHLVISGLTTATPGVVTTTAVHGLTTDDRVMITKVIGTVASEVNNIMFVAKVLTTTTFELYTVNGTAVTTVGAYTSGGQVTKVGPKLGITDVAPIYKLTLGTSIMGSDSDQIFFKASQFNSFVNIGDIA